MTKAKLVLATSLVISNARRPKKSVLRKSRQQKKRSRKRLKPPRKLKTVRPKRTVTQLRPISLQRKEPLVISLRLKSRPPRRDPRRGSEEAIPRRSPRNRTRTT